MIKNGEASKRRDGKFVFEMIKNINVIFEKCLHSNSVVWSGRPDKCNDKWLC
jgi:hypothetical protein